jgi:hypothetical protein
MRSISARRSGVGAPVPRSASASRLQEPLALQPQQRLANGRAAHAQVARQRRVAYARAGPELVAQNAVDDGVVNLVAQRNAGDGPVTARARPAGCVSNESHAEWSGGTHT